MGVSVGGDGAADDTAFHVGDYALVMHGDGVGPVVGCHQVGRDGDAAGVGMLDDHAGRGVEGLHAFERGIGVGQVAATLRPLLAGEAVGNWKGPDDQYYDVQVRLSRADRARAEDLERVPLASSWKRASAVFSAVTSLECSTSGSR